MRTHRQLRTRPVGRVRRPPACEAALTAAESTAQPQSTRLAAAESLLARSEQLRQANLALTAAAVHRGGGGINVVAVGVGATYAGVRVAVGPTVMVGVRIPVRLL